MDHSVPMDPIPDGLMFPDDLSERITFDADRRRLVFHGFMSKAEFDRLWQVHDNWSYRRSLEELFRLATPEDETPKRGLRRILAAFSIW